MMEGKRTLVLLNLEGFFILIYTFLPKCVEDWTSTIIFSLL